jgi:type II secretory pathway component PulF
MSLVVLPGQLVRRAELYYQLAQLTAAGIGLVGAIEQLERHPPSRSFRKPLQLLLQKVHEGATFTDALRASSGWLPQFDIALIEAGERSGRIDSCLRVLADYYTARAKLAKQAISAMLYPVFLIHFAALVFCVIVPWAGSGFNANLNVLFLHAALAVAPLYIFLAIGVFTMQSGHGERWRALVEGVLHFVPILGAARRALVLSRLSLALEALIGAGVSIVEAWYLAADATASPAIRRTVNAWRPEFASGHAPAVLVSRCGKFPSLFVNFYTTGETSGKLDDALHRLRVYYEEEGRRKFEALAEWIPRIIYLVIAIAIGIAIIQFYTGYFNRVAAVTQGF